MLSKCKNNRVSAKEAINSILNNINSIEDNSKIKTLIYGEDFEICGEKATALLLAINEIIQNSYKHAFKNRKSGNIKIILDREDNNITITILDDGIGFNLKTVNLRGLGMGIINSYIKDVLGGQIELYSGHDGTQTIIKFLNK